MKNIFRMFIGIVATLFALGIIGIIILILSPIAIAGAIVYFAIAGLVALLIFVLSVFALFYFAFREEERPNKKDNNYSIKQGKEI